MHPSKAILMLAATVSAIDFRLHTGDCNSAYVACTNVNPGVCCFAGSTFPAASFNAIPSGWVLDILIFEGGGCNQVIENEPRWSGPWDYCARFTSGSHYTGGQYNFSSRKKRAVDTCPAKSGCVPQKPDLLVLEDGKKYDISQLDDSLLKPLIELASNGTTAEDIPAIYDPLAIGA